MIVTFIGLKKPLEPYEELDEYPKISVIIPARDEPILGRTIEVCLNHIYYPLEKKEIIVVDDERGESIALWYQQKYPETVKCLSRRRSFPTKPSALNDAITLCTGDIISIIDVEDIPDRDVFMKVASAVKKGYEVVQVILSISNTEESWISKVFGMEYAGWYRIMVNGRSILRQFVPLGGTGNYFKRYIIKYAGYYDPTNLAEDAELTVRIMLAGWNVTLIDARHYEEAPTTFKAWLKQRTRWFRGWMQSLWKYFDLIFKPRIVRSVGLLRMLSVFVMLTAPFMVLLNWVAYSLTICWILGVTGLLPKFIKSIPFWSIIPLWFNILYYYVWIKGAKLEGIKMKLPKDLLYMFIYMNIMLQIAVLRAFYQELFKPVVWEKTTHVGSGARF